MKWWERTLHKLWHNEGRPHPISIMDAWRIVMHFPVGCFTGWLLLFYPIAGAVFALSFLVYETLEDWRLGDRGYKDVFGSLIGMAVVLVVFHFLR